MLISCIKTYENKEKLITQNQVLYLITKRSPNFL